MHQITELEARAGVVGGVKDFYSSSDFFLENGGAELGAWFLRVTLHRQPPSPRVAFTTRPAPRGITGSRGEYLPSDGPSEARLRGPRKSIQT